MITGLKCGGQVMGAMLPERLDEHRERQPTGFEADNPSALVQPPSPTYATALGVALGAKRRLAK